MAKLHERMFYWTRGSNLWMSEYQADAHSTELPGLAPHQLWLASSVVPTFHLEAITCLTCLMTGRLYSISGFGRGLEWWPLLTCHITFLDEAKKKKNIDCFLKPYRPHLFGPTLNFLGGHLRIFLLFLRYFQWFSCFSYRIIFFQKNVFAYLPTLKNIETFPETRHLFFFLAWEESLVVFVDRRSF